MKLFGNRHGSRDAHLPPSGDGEPEISVSEIRDPEPSAAESTVKKPKKALRRTLVIVGVVVLILAAVLIAYSIWERPPELAPVPSPVPTAQSSGKADAPKTDPGEAPISDDPVAPVEENPYGDGEAPDVAFSSERRDGVYTMLLVGRDFASNSTDTIIIGSFDTVNHTVDCVNIPRDTLINIGWSSTPKKINTVFPGYINSGKSGIDGLKAQVKNLLGYDVDCYAVVTVEAVQYAVDAIGGVWFDVPQDMDYDDPDQYFHVHVKQGYQLLNGYDAVGVLRFRHGYAGGDLDRINVQQSLLKAIAGQMLSLGNIPNLTELIDIFVKNVDTDLTAANMAWFARQFLKCSMDNVCFHTMPSSNNCLLNGISFVSIDVNGWLKLVNERLNPYADDVQIYNVNILTSNYYGTNINATNGVIAGGIDSFIDYSVGYAHNPAIAPGREPEPSEAPEVTAPPAETPAVTETPADEPPPAELPVETPEIVVASVGNAAE